MSRLRPDRKLNMQAGQLPIHEQLEQFRTALRRNRTLMEVFARNVVTSQPPEAGILEATIRRCGSGGRAPR
jgi:CHAD domain-containing protein